MTCTLPDDSHRPYTPRTAVTEAVVAAMLSALLSSLPPAVVPLCRHTYAEGEESAF